MAASTRLRVALFLLMAIACGLVSAQPYPAKPVRVIVVFPPGGATDTVSRLVFQKVGEQLNQQFVIDNRAGAAGMLGAAVVAKSPPDGYTLLVYSQTMLNNMHLYNKVAYDALQDFVGITSLTRIVGMLSVHPALPVRTTKDFIALAKTRPNEVLYGSAGIGAYQHFAMSVFCSMTGLKMNHVPFKGGAPAVVALMGGEIHSIITPIAEVFAHLKAGRVRPIAVSSEARTAQFPEIPTIGETVKGYEFTSWFGAFVPAGTPRPIVDRLNAEIRKALADAQVSGKLTEQALDPLHRTPEEFAKFLKFEYDRMKDIVKVSGAKVE